MHVRLAALTAWLLLCAAAPVAAPAAKKEEAKETDTPKTGKKRSIADDVEEIAGALERLTADEKDHKGDSMSSIDDARARLIEIEKQYNEEALKELIRETWGGNKP